MRSKPYGHVIMHTTNHRWLCVANKPHRHKFAEDQEGILIGTNTCLVVPHRKISGQWLGSQCPCLDAEGLGSIPGQSVVQEAVFFFTWREWQRHFLVNAATGCRSASQGPLTLQSLLAFLHFRHLKNTFHYLQSLLSGVIFTSTTWSLPNALVFPCTHEQELVRGKTHMPKKVWHCQACALT